MIYKSLPRGLKHNADLLSDIDLQSLRKANIQGIILDLDNTIVSEDDRFISPNSEDWIQRAKLEGFKLFILSNGKRKYRVKYWASYLNIEALSPARKPMPGAFLKACRYMRLTRKKVVVIGDSFHTDVLGAWLSGCYSIQVASLPHPPRIWEKWIGRYVHRAYPKNRELWPCQEIVSSS